MTRLREYLVGNIAFPLTNAILNRRDILPTFRSLRETEWYPREKLLDLQATRLRSLIRYAYEQVPFYRDRFEKLGLSPGDIRTLEDIRKLPALSRQDVIDHRLELVDRRFRGAAQASDSQGKKPGTPIPFASFRRNGLVRNSSSGSTGAPTIFYEDGSRSARNWAFELLVKSWFGIHPGANEIRMALLATNAPAARKSGTMRRLLWNQTLVPGTNLSDSEYSGVFDQVRSDRPAVLWGYTSALCGLAEHMRSANRKLDIPPRLVITWAAPLHEHEKRLLADTFDCPVTNIYGSREVGHIAARCPENGLHVAQEGLIVETDDLESEILVTNLDLSPMPFIRYRMGDIGSLSDRRCACGRSTLVIEDLVGRTGEVFITSGNRMISPNFWCRVFMNGPHAGAVRRFQVIYRLSGGLKFRIVTGEGYANPTEAYIREMVRDSFPADTPIEFEYLDAIPPQISGKYQMIVKEKPEASNA